jgi:hypothetical protein
MMKIMVVILLMDGDYCCGGDGKMRNVLLLNDPNAVFKLFCLHKFFAPKGRHNSKQKPKRA